MAIVKKTISVLIIIFIVLAVIFTIGNILRVAIRDKNATWKVAERAWEHNRQEFLIFNTQ